jgi:hypothetical protein
MQAVLVIIAVALFLEGQSTVRRNAITSKGLVELQATGPSSLPLSRSEFYNVQVRLTSSLTNGNTDNMKNIL